MRARSIGVALAVVLAVQLGTPAPAEAVALKLSVSGLGAIVHDAQHRRLFVTGNTSNDKVLVVDYDGRIVDSIGNLPGATHMFLEDGTLYVSLYHSNAVALIDSATRKRTGEISLDPYSHPLRISKTSNLLWASVDCHQDEPRFLSVDTSSGATTEHELTGYYPFDCVSHVASPTEDVLYTWESNISATELRRYRVGAPLLPTQPPTLTLEASADIEASVQDVKVSPDGSQVFVAGSGVQVFRASDLVETGSYPQGHGAVAPSSDGRYVATAEDGWYEPDVYVYEPGSIRPQFSDDIAGAYSTAGFVYSGDAELLRRGSRMYVLSGEIYPEPNQHAYIHVVAPIFPTVVRKGNQITPAADGPYMAWADDSLTPGKRFVVLAGEGTDMNRIGGTGNAVVGGLDDGILSYSRRTPGGWNVAGYDLENRRALKVAGGVNTRADEFSAGISGKWLLFERTSQGRTTLLLRNRDTGSIRRLNSSRRFLQGGQINGNWIVWTKCEAFCLVHRWNIAQGIVQLVPQPPRRFDYAASVARDGTVYFARGRRACGRASLMKWNTDSSLYISEGGVSLVRSLPQGKDFSSTFYASGGDGPRVLIGRYACRAKTVDVVEVREP